MAFVKVAGRNLKTPRSKELIRVTFYFTRDPFTEPESDDTFQDFVPRGILDKYKEKEKDLGYLLDYIQKRPEPDDESGLTEKLNDERWVNSLTKVQIYICDLDSTVNQATKDKLIEDIKTLQYEALDDLLDSFFRDHGMDEIDSTERTEYLQNYLKTRI